MAVAAPEGIEILRSFVNTLDIETGKEGLATPLQLRDWLAEHGLTETTDPADSRQLATAVELREALRNLGVANNEGATDPSAVEAVNRIAATLPVYFHLHPDGGAHLEPLPTGVDGALAGLLSIVFNSALDGTWERFKACRNDECAWAFYDTSKNRSRRWCTMEICGNVMNARAYRRRQREADAT